MVFPYRGAIFCFDALAGHARTDYFRQTIDIHRIYSHALFNAQPHVIGPGLGPKNP